MQTLESYLSGRWQAGDGNQQILLNPATEEPVAQTSASGLELAAGLAHARTVGGANLRAMSIAERGLVLGRIANIIHEHREALITASMLNGGNTRGDAKFDIDGASGTLAYYAGLAKEIGEARYLSDGESIQIGRSPRMVGRHVYVPRAGVALLINAFNFPAWGFGEKAACALLAGMPIVVKPATSTALPAYELLKLIMDVVPEGAISVVSGSAHELPGLLESQDVIAFTGSSGTAASLRALPNVANGAVRLNVEADSLNGAVLGPDVEAGSDTYDLFVRDVVREMTQKTGQKCTAIRRIFVPAAIQERVRDDLVDRLRDIVVGVPGGENVRMGPVATAQQKRDVSAGIARLAERTTRVLGGEPLSPVGATGDKGYFIPITLFDSDTPDIDCVHEHEVFGPVATMMTAPSDVAELSSWVAKGQGGLVCSIYTDDRAYAAEAVAGIAPHHGRLALGSAKIAAQAPFPGMVMPQLIHGGPGRAGAGEELGGIRGVALYSQRVAIQGGRGMLDSLFGKR